MGPGGGKLPGPLQDGGMGAPKNFFNLSFLIKAYVVSVRFYHTFGISSTLYSLKLRNIISVIRCLKGTSSVLLNGWCMATVKESEKPMDRRRKKSGDECGKNCNM